MEHLALDLIIHLADSGTPHPHLDLCAHCREQVRAARDFHAFLDDRMAETAPSIRSIRKGEGRLLRLAAQTLSAPADTLVRRTLYVEGMDLLVRVVENRTHDRLTGFVIADPQLYAHMTVAFSGLAEAFHPDANGRFDIGPADLDIDPMQVEILIEDMSDEDALDLDASDDTGSTPA